MNRKLKILFAISEITGLAKTGGLADVGRALPMAMQSLGHDVRVVMPYYRNIAEKVNCPVIIEALGVPMGNAEIWCAVRETRLGDLKIYLIEHNHFFNRERYYDNGFSEHADNGERFGFFAKACFQLARALEFYADIFQANDWQTALIPFYLKIHEAPFPEFANSKSVMTIHNGGYQGKYSPYLLSFLGIPLSYFVPELVEDMGQISFLKAGLNFADKITTVSPGYAQELLTPLGSHGLLDLFTRRKEDLMGILNGVDYEMWNPERDFLLPTNFNVNDLKGKKECKTELQHVFQLPRIPRIPIIGVVSRLTHQKGFDYLIPALDKILELDCQMVFLGTGEFWITQQLHELVTQYPHKVGFQSGYNEKLAHLIEAGSDLFLMPSLYEPCGLNQIYSLRYGTLPIVRAVGGLKDTVVDYHPASEICTGFVFQDPTSEAVAKAVERAINVYNDEPDQFHDMLRYAMQQRFDWQTAALKYETLFDAIVP